MSEIYEMYLDACAHADERDEILGHMAGFVAFITIANIILICFAIAFVHTTLFLATFIIAIVVASINILRILIRGLEWDGLGVGLIKIIVSLVILVVVLLCFRFIHQINFVVAERFADKSVNKYLWYYAVNVAVLAHSTITRFI